MKVKLITIFPELYPGPLGISVLGRAMEDGIWSLEVINLREFALDKHSTIDDSPYGGGAGMVMRADVLGNAIDYAIRNDNDVHLLLPTPRGRTLSNDISYELASKKCLVFVCSRFEGVDQRIIDYYKMDEVSIGDYVLSDGDLASMTILSSCLRLIDGVLGNKESLQNESFSTCDKNFCLLEYDHYTRPSSWRGLDVPDILCSGNHAEIDKWRFNNAMNLTRTRRADLLDKMCK